eukprot:15458974-Alexandrium_andersonii.AAC.1
MDVRAAAGVPKAAPVDSRVWRRCTPWAMAPLGLVARGSQEAAALAASSAKGCFRASASACSITIVQHAALGAALLVKSASDTSGPLLLNGGELPFPCSFMSKLRDGIAFACHDGRSECRQASAWIRLRAAAAAFRGTRFKESSTCMGNIAGARASACAKSSRMLNQANQGVTAAERGGFIGFTERKLRATTAAATVILGVRRLKSATAAMRDRGPGTLQTVRFRASK